MKTKKFNLNWQSVLLGMVLCMVLVVVMGSKAASAQAGTAQGNIPALQRPANMNDLWEKSNVLEANTIVLNDRLIRIEKKIDDMNKDMARVLRAIK